MDTLTFLVIFSIILQLTLFYQLKNHIMPAQQVVEDMVEQVIAILTEAFETQIGDYTEAEATAKREEFIARVRAILPPPPPPPPTA